MLKVQKAGDFKCYPLPLGAERATNQGGSHPGVSFLLLMSV